MQVVTPDNFVQLVQTGKVDDFKPPEAPAAEAKPDSKPDDPPRDPKSGEFVAVDTGEKKDDKADTAQAEAKPDDQAGKVEADDESDDDLPEKVRKKIGAKHRAMKEAEEFAEREFNKRKAAERVAEELRQELAKTRTKSGPPPDGKEGSQDPDMPKQDDFKTVGEYADAVIEYKLNKRERENAEKAAKSTAETERERLASTFKKQETEVIAAHPDYRQVVTEFDPTDLPGHIAQYLIESGPLLTYHLAKLPAQERSRIAQLSPIRAIAELGKLEAKLEKPAAKQEVKAEQPAVSRAPSPIKPLNGDGAVPVHKDPATMSFQELREYERQREAERRARR